MDLDNLFQIQSIDKEAKTFWPNICCKERRDKTLEACEDPNGEINRTNIIPFALSQGGDYSRHNLYVEVTDTIKNNGYKQRKADFYDTPRLFNSNQQISFLGDVEIQNVDPTNINNNNIRTFVEIE